jgi:hypothetical protein
MRKAALIVLDVDGVLLDFYQGAASILAEMLGRAIVRVSDKPATRHRYGLTEQEYQDMRALMREHHQGWRNLPTLPGAVEAVRMLRQSGYDVAFLTSCGQSIFDLRRQNLDHLGLKDCELVCVEDCANNKALFALRVGCLTDSCLVLYFTRLNKVWSQKSRRSRNRRFNLNFGTHSIPLKYVSSWCETSGGVACLPIPSP